MGSISPVSIVVVGTVTTELQPQSVFDPQTQVTIAPGGTDTIPANTSRKRVTVMNLSTSLDSVFLGATSGDGTELVPGVWIDIYDTAAIPLAVDAGAAGNVTVGYIEYE